MGGCPIWPLEADDGFREYFIVLPGACLAVATEIGCRRLAGSQAAGIPGSQELTGVECRQHYIDTV